MKLVVFVSVIFALVLALTTADDKINGRIFNGQNAGLGQFTFMALLVSKRFYPEEGVYKKLMCGGALIGPNWVLTAAHCMVRVKMVTVFLGGIFFNDAQVAYVVKKHNIFPNPHYDDENLTKDIALIRIPTTRPCNTISYAPLPFRWENRAIKRLTGILVVTMGFGKTGNGGPLAEHLQWIKLAIIRNDECNQLYEDITDEDICAQTDIPYGSTCDGDSGGPLILRGTKELIGISSAIPDFGCENGSAIVFTRVTSFLPWITETTGIVS